MTTQRHQNVGITAGLYLIAALVLSACDTGGGFEFDRLTFNNNNPSGTPSLPTVSSGARPGPDVLYQPAPDIPELSLQPPFRAEPLMVSGTDAYCGGEYLYQDYLFDDHGANTAPSTTTFGVIPNPFGAFPPTGDVQYPSDAARYAGNAADIVEFRLHVGADVTTFRITFNTVIANDAPAIGIGIARDPGDGQVVAWPNAAGITSQGLDAFITAWATGGEIASRSAGQTEFETGLPLPSGAVTLDLDTNQLTIRVPQSMLPATGRWRLVAGAGLWDGDHGFLPVATGLSPSATQPASGSLQGAPAIFNLAFRFDEPQGLIGGDTAIAFGNWFDELQANSLADGNSGSAFAEINIEQLRGSGACQWLHAPSRDQARIFASRMQVPEGVHEEEPSFGGRLQPYMLHLPPASDELPGFTLALHGNSATYTQWHASSPNYLIQLGDDRNHILLSPLGRSTNRTGVDFDWFEAWADVARRFSFDPERTAITGYSAGGYNTFRTAANFPDLFGGAFAIVGAARLLDGAATGDHTNYISHMGSLRWVPLVAWNQLIDELAPYAGILLTLTPMNQMGLRNELFTFAVGEHFTPGLLDQWIGGAEYLGDAAVTRDPYRVDFTIAPENWARFAPSLNTSEAYPEAHLAADHAYWLSELRTRDEVRDETGTIRGSITAISRAFGVGDPITAPVVRAYMGPPQPATVNGTEWLELPSITPEDRLILQAQNIASVTIDMARAQLSCSAELDVDTDGPIDITLAGCARQLRFE